MFDLGARGNKKMTIGIILHPFGENKPAGLGRYIFDLTKSLIENDQENKYIIYLKNKPRVLPVFLGDNWRIEILGFSKFWRDLGLFFAPKSDIYIFNTPVMPLFFKPKKSIVIALDFAYKYFESKNIKEKIRNFLLFRMNKFALRRADKIVSISEATKKDIINFFEILPSKIEVIYPGFKNICLLKPKETDVPKKYFLFVGVVKERKNVFNIIRAFAEFKTRDKEGYKFVIVGKSGGEYYEKILNFISDKKLEKEVVFKDFVDDNKLCHIYKNAKALVFPGLLEGFGFPILEAMACGLPVITSNKGSLSEISGDASLKVNPENIGEISDAMERISKDENLKESLARKGLERAREFSWQKSAQGVLKVIQKIK